MLLQCCVYAYWYFNDCFAMQTGKQFYFQSSRIVYCGYSMIYDISENDNVPTQDPFSKQTFLFYQLVLDVCFTAEWIAGWILISIRNQENCSWRGKVETIEIKDVKIFRFYFSEISDLLKYNTNKEKLFMIMVFYF